MNAERSAIIYEYEQILLGKSHSFVANFGPNLEYNEKLIVYLWKYVVEDMLRLTPEEAVEKITMDTVKKLHLQNTIKKINTPPGIRKNQLPRYVLSLCYPDKIHYTIEDQVISEYKKILKDEKQKFSKSYFDDEMGLDKATYCLRYAVNTYLGDLDIHGLYRLFADTDKANAWLEEHKLLNVCQEMFPEPLDYYHYTAEETSDFLFLSHKFNKLFTDKE